MNILKFWRNTGQISSMLRITVSWYQSPVGATFNLFNDFPTPLNYTDARWLHSLCTFLATIAGCFELDATYNPPVQRQGDEHLMDIATRSGVFDDPTLRILNQCHIFLNVVTLSDITNAAGTHLIPGIEWGEFEEFTSTSNDHTPIQGVLSLFFWTYFQRFFTRNS
jgi:hypothetical protein